MSIVRQDESAACPLPSPAEIAILFPGNPGMPQATSLPTAPTAGLASLRRSVPRARSDARTWNGAENAEIWPDDAAEAEIWAMEPGVLLTEETRPFHDMVMRAVWGDGYDPATNRVNMAKFADWLQAETSRLGSTLVIRFCRVGINTCRPIHLEAAFDGTVMVSGRHSSKAAIEQIFVQDEDLAAQFRKLIDCHHLLASNRLGRRYTLAWQDCTDEAERDAVWRHYVAMFEKLGTLSNQMVLNGAMLTALASSFANSFPLG